MRKKEIWLGGLFVLAGLFSSCTNEAENEFQKNTVPMELMAEKAGMSFTRSAMEKTEWSGGEEVSLHDGFSQKLYHISAEGEMTATNNDPLYWYTTTEEETLFAWYPASETLLTEWSVAADQTTDEAYQESDFLFAYEKMKFRSERRLKFRHGVVKLILNVKGDGDTVTIIGHYNGKQRALETAGKMTPGKYKRFIVDGGYKEVNHHLQVGDLYYADGSVVSCSEEKLSKRNCIGIVCWVGNPMPSVLYKDVAKTPYTAENDALLRAHPNCVHGLVLSLYTEAGKFTPTLTKSMHDWFMTTSFTSSYVSITGYYDANENNKNKPLRILGYNNWEILGLYHNEFKTDFECFKFQNKCESNFPAPPVTTGWYVPSSGELIALQDKDNSLETLNSSLIKVSDTKMDISATYWSSTERNNKNMYIVSYTKTAGSAGTGGVKTDNHTYRFFLGF